MVLPLALYLAGFAALTWPLITLFSTHFFADQGDGLQNYWNIWWVNRAVTELRQPFWHTPYLHYPLGTTLLGHTLNPFNGLMAIPLLPFFSLLQAHNFAVVFAFVASGYTAFLLAWRFTRAYLPSLVAGAMFTFSNYHFAHAEGHLQLVSMQWIPLFALLWWMLLEKPRPLLGIGAGAALFLVALCDYYYLFFSIIFGALAFLWRAWRTGRVPLLGSRKEILSLGAFLATALLTTGPMVGGLLLLSMRDPLWGAHPTRDLSLDLLAPFIPGGHWRFSELTRFYWGSLPGVVHESSVHIGLSATALLAYLGARRRDAAPGAGLWALVIALFGVLALGPALHLWGREVTPPVLPYAWLEAIFPPLAISGVPVRMMVIVTLAVSVLAAMSLKLLAQHPRRTALIAIVLTLMVVEYLPWPMPSPQLSAPEYVYVLRSQKTDKGVMDLVTGGSQALYYQTIHEKPMAFGYISRVPQSVATVDYQMNELAERGEWGRLREEFGIRYLVAKPALPVAVEGRTPTILFEDSKARLYDLGER